MIKTSEHDLNAVTEHSLYNAENGQSNIIKISEAGKASNLDYPALVMIRSLALDWCSPIAVDL